MQKTWTKRLLPLVVIIIAVIIASLMITSRSELPRRASEAPLPIVDVVSVEPGPVAVTIRSRGTVAPSREIELVSEVTGRVVWMAPEFVEGGAVKEGATLLRIDPIDYEVALSDARATLASAEFSLAEVQVVLKRAAIAEAEARLQAARDRLRQAQVDLANTAITAPFAAVVDTQRVDLGQYVQTGTALMKLLSTSVAEVRLPLLASDVPFVRYGQEPDGSWPQATLTARFGDMEHSWQARLVRLEKRVDAQTRVFYLVAQVEQPYAASLHPVPLSIGLFVEAEISGSSIAQGIRLPRSALHKGDLVYVLEQGTLSSRKVSLVRRDEAGVIVGQGLGAGEQVVLSRLDMMVEGMPVSLEQ